jgi:hypothetical protein
MVNSTAEYWALRAGSVGRLIAKHTFEGPFETCLHGRLVVVDSRKAIADVDHAGSSRLPWVSGVLGQGQGQDWMLTTNRIRPDPKL